LAKLSFAGGSLSRGALQAPAGNRITRMRLIGLRRGTSRDLSSIGNHLKEIGVIAVTPL